MTEINLCGVPTSVIMQTVIVWFVTPVGPRGNIFYPRFVPTAKSTRGHNSENQNSTSWKIYNSYRYNVNSRIVRNSHISEKSQPQTDYHTPLTPYRQK